MNMLKFGVLRDGKHIDFKYKKEYAIEKIGEVGRIIASPDNGHIKFMLDLVKGDDIDKYSILYILVVPRSENKEGRYEIANSMTWNELTNFCEIYSNYLQSDGRHNFWVINHNTGDLVVYDRHNVIYIYENLIYKIKILEEYGYKNVKELLFPEYHVHYYNEENDHYENEIISKYEWIYFPLEEDD